MLIKFLILRPVLIHILISSCFLLSIGCVPVPSDSKKTELFFEDEEIKKENKNKREKEKERKGAITIDKDRVNEGAFFGEVKRVLKQNCIACHNPKSGRRNLVLNTEQQFIESGLIEKGKPEKSILYLILKNNITSTKGTMPPSKALNSLEIKLVFRWISNFRKTAEEASSKKVYSCNNSSLKKSLPSVLRRLTKNEYINTYKSLLGGNFNLVQDFVNLIPNQNSRDAKNFQKSMSLDQLEIMGRIADKIATEMVNKPRLIRGHFGSCAIENIITDKCSTNFIKSFGVKIHRRPLTAEQVISYKALFDNPDLSSNYLKLKTLISAMYQSPYFLFLFDRNNNNSIIGSEKIYERDQYEIASYMSYALTQSPPHYTLIRAAGQNKLGTIEEIRFEAKRLLETTTGKKTIGLFIADWLQLSRASEAPDSLKFLNDFKRDQHKEIVTEHTKNYGVHLITQNNATLKTLLSSKTAYVDSIRTAKLYGLPTWNEKSLMSNVGTARAGILATPGVNSNGGYYSSVISRGVLIRRNVICDELASPDFSILGKRNDIVTPIRTENSNRDYWEKFTMTDNACAGCHSQINALAYPFEKIDSIGRNRALEPIFTSDYSKIIQTHQIDTRANPQISFSDNFNVSNPYELGVSLSENYKVKACFVRKVFEHAFKVNTNEKYFCYLSELEKKIQDPSYPLINVFADIVASKYSLYKNN